MNSIVKYLFLLTCILMVGCLDTFTFDSTGEDSSIVVDGQLLTNSGPHTIRVSNVLTFGDKYFDPVSGVTVDLYVNNSTYKYDEISPGIYVIPEGILTPQPGDECYIEVLLPNGDRVKSTPDIIPQRQILDEVNAVFRRETTTDQFGINRPQRIVELSINSNYPDITEQKEFYLRFGIEEDYSYPEVFCGGLHQPKTCYVNIPSFSKDLTLFNSSLSSKNQVDSLVLFKKQNLTAAEFRGKHYFSVFQYSITQSAYEYWLRVKEVTNQRGTVFDKPPAAVIGNLINETNETNLILGFFELANVSIQRTSIVPFEYFAGATDQDFCGPFLRSRWPQSCCNCSLISDATTLRPPWF